MPQASPLSRKTMTRDPVFGFGRSREILCVASERTPGRRSRGVPHLPARLASPWRRGWWHPRRPPPRSPPLRPRTPGRWSRATTTTARTWRGASGEKRTIRPRTNPTPASAAPSGRLRVRPTRARAARARARRCVGCVRRWSRKGRAKKSEPRVLLKKKKKREPARARLERLRVRSSARRYRDLGLCERECAALAIATELVFSESSRGIASRTLDGVFSPRTVDAESAGSATCANDEPKETPKKKKKKTFSFDVFDVFLFRVFPASTRDTVRDVRGVRAARKTPSRVDRFRVGVVRDVRFRDRKCRKSNAEAEGIVRAEPSFAKKRRGFASRVPNGAKARGVSKPRARVRPSRRLGVRRRRRARARRGGARRRGTLHVARRHERDRRRRRRRRRAIRRAGPAATPVTRLATLRERATRPYRRSIASAYAVPGVTTLSLRAHRGVVESWSRGVVS